MTIVGANGVTYNTYSEYAASGTTPANNNTIVASPNTGFITTIAPGTTPPQTPIAAANAGWSLADITSWFSLGTTAIQGLVGNIPALIGTLAAPAVQSITALLPAPTPIGAIATAADNFFNGSASNQQSSTPKTGFNPGNFQSGNFNPAITQPVNFVACNTYRTLKGIPLTGKGIVTRNMAIAAVTDFYSGAIPKSCAITIVVDYFASTPNAPGAAALQGANKPSSGTDTAVLIISVLIAAYLLTRTRKR